MNKIVYLLEILWGMIFLCIIVIRFCLGNLGDEFYLIAVICLLGLSVFRLIIGEMEKGVPMEEKSVHGKVFRHNCSWFYLKKKHTCFKCQSILKIKKRNVAVNSDFQEAEKYDFYVTDAFLKRKVKFDTYYFECQKCGTIYEISELKKLEKVCMSEK